MTFSQYIDMSVLEAFRYIIWVYPNATIVFRLHSHQKLHCLQVIGSEAALIL